MLAGAARFAIAAVLLGAVAAASMMRNRGNRNRETVPWAPSIVLGLTLTGLPFALAVWAKDLVSAGVVAVLYAAMPLMALFFGWKVSDVPGKIPVMAVGLGGVALLAAQGIDYSARQLGGVLLLGAAVALGAFSLNYAKGRIRPGHILISCAIQCAAGSVLLLFLSGAEGIPAPANWSGASVASLSVLAAAEGVIAFPLLFWLLSRIEAWQAASLQWLTTLVAVAEAGMVLRAKPTLQMGSGAAIIVVALLWLMKSDEASADATGAVTLQITK